ncbi:MAG: hypothetical protein ACOCSE_00100 [Chitinivibrionales bacterium]
MSDLKQYIEAEIKEILNSMDEKSRQDPELIRLSAMKWIKNNAENFRREWESIRGSVVVDKGDRASDEIS